MGNPLYPVATEINIAKYSAVLARKQTRQQQGYAGGSVSSDLHKLLVMESEIIDYQYQNYPSQVSLIPAGWYLYSLCGPYINAALKAIGNGTGGAIIDPTTNQPINLIGVTRMWTVGDASTGPLMNAGDTGFTVNDTGILFDTVALGYTGAAPFPRTGTVPAGQTTYLVTYTKDSITVNFANPFSAVDGEQYALTYLRAGAGSAFNPGTGAGLPAQSGHEGEVLFTDGENAYWRYPCTKITSADFSQSDGVTCTNAEWAHNSFVIEWDDLPKVLEPGVDYSLTTNGFTITIPGFDARTQSYNFTIWLTGKNAVT